MTDPLSVPSVFEAEVQIIGRQCSSCHRPEYVDLTDGIWKLGKSGFGRIVEVNTRVYRETCRLPAVRRII